MNVSYRWLLDYVDCPWEPAELADRLTMSGLMVERMERLGEPLEGVVTARILSVEDHPDADALFVVRLQAGGRELTVVTGAENVSADDIVPAALPGTRLPGGEIIERALFRGVESEGMICSERELGLGDDGSGIMILPPDTPVGIPLEEALGLDDWVFELEVYPNRPDCLGVIGVAREVAALSGRPLRLPPMDYTVLDGHVRDQTDVSIEDEELCARYVAHVAEDVRIAPSPLWMQQRLRVAGMRPINNVVDVTNYVMWEWGQPLHAFDYDTLAEHRVIVRRAHPGESILSLDGKERTLQGDMLVIADAKRPIAIAGVMGGAETEVTDRTRTILLESARFDATSVRRTARDLGLRTEASHRFEKGLDPEIALPAARRALYLLEQVAGARVYAGAVDAYPKPRSPRSMSMSPERVNRFLGVKWDVDAMADALRRLEFEVEPDPDRFRLHVTVPTFRADVTGEADLAEEIVRLIGFDQVPSTLPEAPAEPGGLNPRQRTVAQMRDVLVGMGFLEAITYSFVSPSLNDVLRLPEDHAWRRQIPLRNPLSEEQSVMRTNVLGGLLEAVARNRSRRVRDVHLFEIGAVFNPKDGRLDGQPEEPTHLGLIMTGSLPERDWGRHARPADFFALKGVVEQLADALRIDVSFRRGAHPSFHPGRCAEVVYDGRPIGVIGEVHPEVLRQVEAYEGACAAEIVLDPILGVSAPLPRFEALPRYPLVRRDLALLVPKDHAAADVEARIREVAGPLLDELTLFDVYEGKQLPEGVRSLAYALGFRSDERTLTDEEVSDVIARVEQTLETTMGVRIRR